MKSAIRLHVVRVFAVLAMLAGLQSAQATLTTLVVQGTVNTVDPALASSFTVGHAFTLTYTFDPTVAARAGSTSTSAVYDALQSLTISSDSYTATSNATQEIQVDDNPGSGNHDRYAVVSRASNGLSGPNVGQFALTDFLMGLTDSTDAAFSNDTLPSSLDLSTFDTKIFQLDFSLIVGGNTLDAIVNNASVIGTITSITQPTVPEPATLGLVALGLSGIGLIRRRRAARA